MNYEVIWCKDCPAVGVITIQPTSDRVVAWANKHVEATGHRRIASLPFGKLRDLFDTATEAINRDYMSDDMVKLT